MTFTKKKKSKNKMKNLGCFRGN